MTARSIRPAVSMMALALLATGCFKAETRITVEDDGSGRVDALVAIDVDAAVELAGAFDLSGEEAPQVTPDQACADFVDDQEVPEGAVVEPYEEGDLCGVRYSVEFGPGEFESVVTDAADGEEGDFVLRREGDAWVFEGDLSGSSGDLDAGAFLGEGLFDDAEITFGIRLPGRQVDHNATFIDSDGTLVWEIDLADPPSRLFARTEPGATITGSGGSDDGGTNWGLVLVVLLVLAAIVAGVVILVRRRRQDGTPPAPAWTPPVGAVAAPPSAVPPAPHPQPPAAPDPPAGSGGSLSPPPPP
ncbi:MAG: hypothetical protein ACE5GB_08665, partial [Acidimicrobiales bacterium]